MKKYKSMPIRWLLVLGTILGCHAERVSAAEQPNITFIFADDWGYGDLSCHDSSFCETPHIDRMANEGIDFSNFTVNSPVCSPSRVAVMTGQFPARQCIHQHFAGANSNRKRDVSQSNIEVVEKLRQQLDAWKQSLPQAPDQRCCAGGTPQ